LALCVSVGVGAVRVGGNVDSVEDATARGAYADAERIARAQYSASERSLGPAALETLQSASLLLRALVDNGHAGLDEATAISTRVVSGAEAQLTSMDPRLADWLDAVGYAHAARGEFDGARGLYQRAVDIYRQAHDRRQAATLLHLADAFMALDRFDDAASALDSARELVRMTDDVESIGAADVEERAATLHRLRGDLPSARQHLSIAVDIRRRLTPAHPQIAALDHLRGDIAYLSGDINEARSAYTAAVERATMSLGPAHPSTALYQRKLALVEWTLGDVTRARQLREQALSIAEHSLAPCHPDVASAANDLAVSDLDRGDYRGARALFERARGLYERCLGPTHSLAATAVYNLALVAESTGDWDDAERLLNGAIRAWSSALGPEHPFVTRARDALADVEGRRGMIRKSFAMHQQVLATRRRVLGPQHPDVARTLTSLAFDARRIGDAALALRLASEAETIYTRSGVPSDANPRVTLLAFRGDIEQMRGNLRASESSYTEARRLRIQRLGAAHPTVAVLTSNLADVKLQSGDYAQALTDALDAEAAGRRVLQFTIRELPERPALAFADSRPKGLDVALSVAAIQHTDDSSRVYDAVIRSRAVVLDELAARSHAVDVTDAGVAGLRDEMASARQRYANLSLRALQNDGSVPVERLDEARLAKEQAERAVAERSADTREELVRSGAGLEQVRAAIPTGSALVSFVKYDRTRPPARPNAPPLPLLSSYAAFVMTGGASGQLTFVPLGSAARAEPLIRAWRAAVLSGAGAVDAPAAEARYRESAMLLRAAVWDPIARHLAGAQRVYIVPDGQLNLVNFASLPAPARGYLAESALTIHYLSTERDLLVDAPRSGSMTALVVGRPSFGASTPRDGGITGTRDGCVGAGGWRFGDLPGTGQEAIDISRVWSRAGGEVTLLTGAGATKIAFRQAASTRRVVHLATHGFFLGAGCAPAATRTRSVGGLVSADVPAVKPSPTRNPLLLSGLALAGANRRASQNADQDTGILTADEIAGLDLRGTEWAVLSACDTGLGEIRSGEGVFGLRRAFQIAGARTVIMSLWPVDDAATRVWMRALYEGRLIRKLDTADAVRQASLSVLKQRRAAGQSTHPFYWAAFVAAGDWR
jgi:CHAT domain-containing protein/tetratricopeptide (TPR) repeat protein